MPNDVRYNLLEVLDQIDPELLDYEQWCKVGMILKHEGLSVSDWDSWSRRDCARYHEGECAKKWESFREQAGSVAAGGSLVEMARSFGWRPPSDEGYELGWNYCYGGHKDDAIIDVSWVEGQDVASPEKFIPKRQLIKYIETLFESSENVGYVTKSWEKEGRFLPTKGFCDRTAGQLIEELSKCKDICDVIGDYSHEAGAWIRFNPLDGEGVKNSNVTDFRYALVESDTLPLDKQNALIRELQLPTAILVFSGSKSLHAIVKIDAKNYDEYRSRVDYLYGVCRKNGLALDTQNKNPSRLSRMPGVMRGHERQFIIDTNIGKASWDEWRDYIENATDDLPDFTNLEAVWDHMPEIAPPLIDGILRRGHKMLLAGPSKAGKSYLLIELAVALAEGRPWLNWPCAQGKVLYVNLELDHASCLHRFRDVYERQRITPTHAKDVIIWGLRGQALSMDVLAPILIRRIAGQQFSAVIIDPIYKVITGDENSADAMARFCNLFDRICFEAGVSVIYCHHHSKGVQGQKRSMDRASGSGVFARDPDSLLDLIELELTDSIRDQQLSDASIKLIEAHLNKYYPQWSETDFDALTSVESGLRYSLEHIGVEAHNDLLDQLGKLTQAVACRTAWRIDGTLREFPKFSPVNLWFNHPIHSLDTSGILSDLESEGEALPWKKGADQRKKYAKQKRAEAISEFEEAIKKAADGNPPTIEEVAAYMGVTDRTVRRKLKINSTFEGKDILKEDGSVDRRIIVRSGNE